METTKEERVRWRKECLASGTAYCVNECDLIRLLDDADEVEAMELGIANAAINCATKDVLIDELRTELEKKA